MALSPTSTNVTTSEPPNKASLMFGKKKSTCLLSNMSFTCDIANYWSGKKQICRLHLEFEVRNAFTVKI